jgi:CarboxypepD_reg-like domain
MQSRYILPIFMLFFSTVAFAQSGAIKGNVKDGSTGEAVVGANVIIAGTSIGNIADLNGDFQIQK